MFHRVLRWSLLCMSERTTDMNVNKILIDKSLIEKCFDYMTGTSFINGVKSADFPNNLLEGTDKQREVVELLNKGMTTREVGELLGVSAMTVSNRHNSYLKGINFYTEWLSFWEFSEPVRKRTIVDLFDDWKRNKELSSKEKHLISRFVTNCNKKDIVTVGDLMFLYASNTQRDARAIISITHRDFIFGILREYIDTLLTVSNLFNKPNVEK